MPEYVCQENPKNRPHLVGRTEAERRIVVPLERLRRYVGTYRAVETVLVGVTELDSWRGNKCSCN
jgi:hypothetical protein